VEKSLQGLVRRKGKKKFLSERGATLKTQVPEPGSTWGGGGGGVFVGGVLVVVVGGGLLGGLGGGLFLWLGVWVLGWVGGVVFGWVGGGGGGGVGFGWGGVFWLVVGGVVGWWRGGGVSQVKKATSISGTKKINGELKERQERSAGSDFKNKGGENHGLKSRPVEVARSWKGRGICTGISHRVKGPKEGGLKRN